MVTVFILQYVLDASLTRVCLGTAVLLQAGVVLRYVSYFKELNVRGYQVSITCVQRKH